MPATRKNLISWAVTWDKDYSMQITILGTASAWGPNPFDLNWNTQLLEGRLGNGQVVRFRQYCTSLLVRSEQGDCLLVDCGPDFCRQLWEFRIEKLSAILLTHSHWDHIAGLDYLHHYRSASGITGRKPRIPLYGTRACLRDKRHGVLPKRGFHYLVKNGIVAIHNLEAIKPLQVGSITVTAFQVRHHESAPGAVGFIFEEQNASGLRTVLYSGDFCELLAPTDGFFHRTFDLVILECNQWAPRPNGHSSFLEIVELLKHGVLAHAKIQQLTLVHFGEHGPNGPATTYQQWREAALTQLQHADLDHIVSDADALIAYEGLTLPC